MTAQRGDRADLANLDRTAVARLRPGVGIDGAESDLARLLTGLPDAYPDAKAEDLRGVRPVIRPLRSSLVRDVRRPLELLGLSALLVLVVTVANVTALFLVRAERRRGELGVSRALGAGAADLARRFVSEGLVLSLVGGVLGGLAAQLAVEARFGFASMTLPRLHEIDFGPIPWAFALGVALLAGLTVAGGSFLRARDVLASTAGMGAVGRSSIGGWRRVHTGLAVLQVALSLALLVTSSVMVETLVRVLRVDPGFDPAGTIAFALHTPISRYPRYAEAAAFYREARNQLGALPGVRGAEAAARLPLTPAPDYLHESILPTDAPADFAPAIGAVNIVTPGWFRLMNIELLEGEPFGDLRSSTDAPPIVASAGLARALFGGSEAVGRTVRLPGIPAQYPVYTVAGVVSDVPSESLSEAFEHTLYVPALLDADAVPELGGLYPYVPRAMIVAVRGGEPGEVVAGARRIVGTLDPSIPVANVRSLERILADATAQRRLVALPSALAAVAALFLGVTGVYGIVAYSVSQRTAEIGVRMALGSTAPQVERVVLAQTARIAVAGTAFGLATAFGLTHTLRGQLFEVTPTDPTAYVVSVALVVLVVLAAGWVPARRAGRLDVVDALRLR